MKKQLIITAITVLSIGLTGCNLFVSEPSEEELAHTIVISLLTQRSQGVFGELFNELYGNKLNIAQHSSLDIETFKTYIRKDYCEKNDGNKSFTCHFNLLDESGSGFDGKIVMEKEDKTWKGKIVQEALNSF